MMGVCNTSTATNDMKGAIHDFLQTSRYAEDVGSSKGAVMSKLCVTHWGLCSACHMPHDTEGQLSCKPGRVEIAFIF